MESRFFEEAFVPELGARSTPAPPANVPWHQHPVYNRYWRYHEKAMLWLRQHDAVRRNIQARIDDPSMRSSYVAAYQVAVARQCATDSYGCASQAQPQTLSIREEYCANASEDFTYSDGIDAEAEDVEFQVTPELVEFLAQSHRHRKQRDADKLTENIASGGGEVGHIEASQTSASRLRLTAATCQAPKERPGSRRTHEMKLLYGDSAALIHGMETAMQLRFDTGLDKNQPVHWPNIPLKLPFTPARDV